MRNVVAKNDFNRASVHEDKKKSWEPDILEGLEEHILEIQKAKDIQDVSPQEIALSEYFRGVKDSGIV